MMIKGGGLKEHLAEIQSTITHKVCSVLTEGGFEVVPFKGTPDFSKIECIHLQLLYDGPIDIPEDFGGNDNTSLGYCFSIEPFYQNRVDSRTEFNHYLQRVQAFAKARFLLSKRVHVHVFERYGFSIDIWPCSDK